MVREEGEGQIGAHNSTWHCWNTCPPHASNRELFGTDLSPVSVREETSQDLPPPLQTPHVPQDGNVEGGGVGGGQQVD